LSRGWNGFVFLIFHFDKFRRGFDSCGGCWRRLERSSRQLTLNSLDAPGKAGLLVMEIGKDLALDQPPEGDGQELSFILKVFDDGFQFAVGAEFVNFEGDQLGFKNRDAAETPLEIGEFGDELLGDGAMWFS
jgi:hypothetical protein